MGTVLSLWDAAELDAAGEDGEVLPKFINLTDASIKMVNHSPDWKAKCNLLVETDMTCRSNPYRPGRTMNNRYRIS